MHQVLRYCTYCGQQVSPYEPSTTVYYDSNEQTDPEGMDRHYWCSRCNRQWRATKVWETGYLCRTCGQIVQIDLRFCGYCGLEAPR